MREAVWSAPLFSAWRNLGMSVGSCWPSASRRTAYWASAARAALMSVFTAAPYPMLRGCLTTTAPASSATLAVSFVELPSTASILSRRSPHREELVKHLVRVSRSLSVGRIIM